MPSKKHTKVTLALADDNSAKAVIIVGDNANVKPENSSLDEADKPIYIRRV